MRSWAIRAPTESRFESSSSQSIVGADGIPNGGPPGVRRFSMGVMNGESGETHIERFVCPLHSVCHQSAEFLRSSVGGCPGGTGPQGIHVERYRARITRYRIHPHVRDRRPAARPHCRQVVPNTPAGNRHRRLERAHRRVGTCAELYPVVHFAPWGGIGRSNLCARGPIADRRSVSTAAARPCHGDIHAGLARRHFIGLFHGRRSRRRLGVAQGVSDRLRARLDFCAVGAADSRAGARGDGYGTAERRAGCGGDIALRRSSQIADHVVDHLVGHLPQLQYVCDQCLSRRHFCSDSTK